MKRNKGNFERLQRECMVTLIRDILSDKSVTQITYENRHGVISASRDSAPQTVTHAIGFQIGDDTADDYGGETMTTTVNKIDWRGWKITAEQAKAITNGDDNARNAFYFDNLDRIRKMARGYIYRRKFTPNGGEFTFDDCVNGLYLDIPLFDFQDGVSVSRSVYRSFSYSIYGGWLYVSENNRKLFDRVYQGERLYILDQPAQYKSRSGDSTDDGAPLIDKITSAPSPENEVINGNGLTVETLETVAGKYLSKQENALFVDLLNGYEKHHICDRLALKTYRNSMTECARNYGQTTPKL